MPTARLPSVQEAGIGPGPRCPCAVNSKLIKFEHVWGVVEIQYIMGNVHMGTSLRTDKHNWKQYLPTTSLAVVINVMNNVTKLSTGPLIPSNY